MLMEEKAVYEEGQNPSGFWDRPIGSTTMSSYVKDMIKEKLVRYTATADMADPLAVYLTEEEKKAAGEAAVAAWAKISGLYDTEEYEITAENASDLYYKQALYDSVYRKIAGDATAEITEDSTRVLQAEYVLIPSEAGAEPANAIYAGIREGKSFADACAENGYSLLTDQIIRRGELPSGVDNIVFALKDSEFSEVIESKEGYYIFRCIDDKLLAESDANYHTVLEAVSEQAFRDAFRTYAEKTKMVFDNKYWDKLKIGEIK